MAFSYVYNVHICGDKILFQYHIEKDFFQNNFFQIILFWNKQIQTVKGLARNNLYL